MYSMKEVCEKTGLTYETLRFYCNEGLIPNVQRGRNNYRQFSENDVLWINGLICLRRCDMSIQDMKTYMQLCMQGESSIPARKEMLAAQKEILLRHMQELLDSIEYIDNKQAYYDGVLNGTISFSTYLKKTEE